MGSFLDWFRNLFNPSGGFGARSPRWRQVRAAHLRDFPTCAACGSTRDVVPHHVVPYHVDPTRELDRSNLVTLCEGAGNCHYTFGHLRDWRSWNVTAREDAAAYLLRVRSRPCPPEEVKPQ